MNGFVKNVAGMKQYGFIRAEDGKEYFFHKEDFNGFWNDLALDVENGRTVNVTFESIPSDKGPRAGEVTRTDAGV
jgi:cold shock CspA family protein